MLAQGAPKKRHTFKRVVLKFVSFISQKQQKAQKTTFRFNKSKKRSLIGGERGFSNTIIFSKTSDMYHSFRLRALEKQMLINLEIGEIISLAFEKVKVYDFQLFKSSKIRLKPGAQLAADSCYRSALSKHFSLA